MNNAEFDAMLQRVAIEDMARGQQPCTRCKVLEAALIEIAETARDCVGRADPMMFLARIRRHVAAAIQFDHRGKI